MPATQEQFNDSRASISRLASTIRTQIITPILHQNGDILDSDTAGVNLKAALNDESNFYSQLGEDGPAIAAMHSTACRNYLLDNGMEPSEELLASAAQAMQNIFDGNQLIFDSSLSQTDGIPFRNHMIAMTLPTMLNMVTADDVMMVPAGYDKSEVFRVIRTAGSTFGDLTEGDEIDEFFEGQYTSMDQFKAAGTTDGTTTVFTANFDNPLVKERTMAYIDGVLVAQTVVTGKDTDVQAYTGLNTGTVTLAVNHTTGVVTLTLSNANIAANDLEVEIKSDIRIENNEAAIPLIQHEIESHILRPHESAISSSTTLQARLKMQRELGLDTNSMNISAAANILAAEKDRRNLFLMYKAARTEFVWGSKIPASGADSTVEHIRKLKAYFQKISTAMIAANKKAGIQTIYVGTQGLSLLGYLPEGDLKYVAGYREIPQPHVVGTLFNRYRLKFSPMIKGNEMLLVAKGHSYGDAGIVNGDAVPAMSFKHSIKFGSLNHQNTMYEMSIRDIHPHNGGAYFAKLVIDPLSSGEPA